MLNKNCPAIVALLAAKVQSEGMGCIVNRLYQLWATPRPNGSDKIFCLYNYAGIIPCWDKIFFIMPVADFYESKKYFGNSHQHPNYVLDINRI